VRSSPVKHSGMDHTVCTLQIHHTCLHIVSIHQTAPPPLTGIAAIRLQLTTHLSDCLNDNTIKLDPHITTTTTIIISYWIYRWNLGTEINVESVAETVQQRVSSDNHHTVVQALCITYIKRDVDSYRHTYIEKHIDTHNDNHHRCLT